MAKCIGTDSPYGCGHHKEHVEAARKGWRNRYHVIREVTPEAHRHISLLFGSHITDAHEHRLEKLVRFQEGGKWYELPTKEFRRLVGEGRKLERKTARAQRYEDEQEAKRERDYLREMARLERRKAREDERRKLREAREGEKAQRAETRERARQEAQLAAARRAEYQSVVHFIRSSGGLRPYRKNAEGKTPELEEWRGLPRAVKNSKGRYTQDEIIDELRESFPWLRVETGDDLAQYLQKEERHRKYGGMRRGHQAA